MLEPRDLVGLDASFFEKGIYLTIAVSAPVVGAFTMEQNVQEVLGVRIVGAPTDGKHLETALVQVLQEGGPFGLLDLNLNSQRLLPRPEHYLHIQAHRSSEVPGDGQGYARNGAGICPVAGLAEQPFGPLRVVTIPLQVWVVGGKTRRDNAYGRDHQIRKGGGSDLFFVDGVVQGQPEFGIVKGRFVHVQPDEGHAETRWRGGQLSAEGIVRVLYPLQVGQTQAGKMDLIILVHQHGVAPAEDEFHRVQEGRTQVIKLVTAEDDRLADFVPLQPERTGAVGLKDPIVLIALHVLPVDDEPGWVGHLGQEIRLGSVDG